MSQDKQFYTTFFTIMGGLAVLAIILVMIASNLSSEVADYKPDDVVIANIKPVGQVNVASEAAPAPASATATAGAAPAAAGSTQAAAEPRTGEQVFNGHCMACHATGAAGAPKMGDKAAWAPRIAKGIDALLASATAGLNAMPPKGLCMDCSDAELRAAIEYMVDRSQ